MIRDYTATWRVCLYFQRNHIHFAIGLADDPNVVSGMRKSCEVAIEIEMSKAMEGEFCLLLTLCGKPVKGRVVTPKIFKTLCFTKI